MSMPDFRDQNGAGLAERSLARKFDRSAVLKLLLLGALLGFVVYWYVEPTFSRPCARLLARELLPPLLGKSRLNFTLRGGVNT